MSARHWKDQCVDKCPEYMKLSYSEIRSMSEDDWKLYVEACQRASCAGSGQFMYTWGDVNKILVDIGWEWVDKGNGHSVIQRRV